MTNKSLEELLRTDEPAWADVQSWLTQATNTVEILPREQKQAEQTLRHLQVTVRSPLGAMAYETGGVLFASGWLRFLGSGSQRMHGSLFTWNGGTTQPAPPLQGALIVAYDVVGGFFVLNGGAFSGKQGNAYYLAPDTLQWEDLGYSYTALLQWAATGDLDTFYDTTRWSGWQKEVEPLSGDRGILIYPPLWADGEQLEKRSRNSVPMQELWGLTHELRQQLHIKD